MGTATMDILALSYVCSESGIQFPRTFVLQVDNAAAQAFASQTTYSGRSRLRHVDARQEWVQALRDSKLVKVVHVDTTENLSDLFTKALDLATFTRFRKQLMHFPGHSRCNSLTLWHATLAGPWYNLSLPAGCTPPKCYSALEVQPCGTRLSVYSEPDK
jgi:hypothetical protein